MLGRSLFPDRAFERRLFKLNSEDASFSYEGFLKQPVVDQAQARRLKQNKGLPCLERGILDPADTFLKWLVRRMVNFFSFRQCSYIQETSVFEAMERKVLKAFQLRVFEDKENADNVLETWTFMTTYPDELGGAPQMGNIEVERRGGQAVTVTNARENLTETVKSIYELTDHMKSLPSESISFLPQRKAPLTLSSPKAERYLGLFLWYNDDCDPDYLPAGFEDCVLGDINFPTADACRIRSRALRPYQDGVHRYEMSLIWCGAKADLYTCSFQVASTYVDKILHVPEGGDEKDMPCDLSYSQVRSPDADIQMLEAPTTSGQGEAEPPISSQHKHQFSASSRVVPSTSEEDVSLDGRGKAASSSPLVVQEDTVMTAADPADSQSQIVDAPVAQVRGLSIADSSMLWLPDQTQGSWQQSQLSVQAWDATETQKLQHMVSTVSDMLDVHFIWRANKV